MTLILSIPTCHSVVLAADGQITSGHVRAAGQKLFKLNSHCAWAGAGEVALIQRVEAAIGSIGGVHPLTTTRDQLANAIKQCVTELLQLDFRTPFFQGSPDGLLSLHPGDFVFAECREGPRILHITAYGTPEWISRPYATGNGADFAYALLCKYHGTPLATEEASVLAVKVIEEAIRVGAYGLGPPIDVWHITKDGVSQLDDSRLAALSDASQQLREAEIHLLLGPPACIESTPVEEVIAGGDSHGQSN